MLLNCRRCTALMPEYVNTASGLDLHRCHWLSGDHEMGPIHGGWNHLVEVQDPVLAECAPLLYGPWADPGSAKTEPWAGPLAAEWFSARDDAFRLSD